ncbi:TolC family protein [Sphingobacterium cellulitidis]|uniref:TolC family protein n=1 Tax=Sphingobacterium cellulitidis TaxID=1768011 RepID=UPI00211AB802|nr:TolC family protein [Sphingobacterium cellulitidis]
MIKLNVFYKILLIGILLGFKVNLGYGQQMKTLELEECYELARLNYPMIKQHSLIEKTKDFSMDNMEKAILPQMNIAGQATHQSDVTSLPISLPNMEIPSISKNQYKVYAEISQSITGLLNLKDQKENLEASSAVETQKVEVEMYKLRERINNLFFSILMLDKQQDQIKISIADLQSGIDKLETAVKNGVALRSSASNLQAERLKAEQRIVEVQYNKKSFLNVLSILIGQKLDDQVQLIVPKSPTYSDQINRPEQALFSLQRKALDVQNKLIDDKSLPQFSMFVQGGVGQPALNMLSNKSQGFYIAGLRLAWNLNTFYTQRNEKSLVKTNQEMLDVQEETFLFNTKMNLSQQETEVLKIQELLKTDQQIIELREQVKNSTLNQLNYGTATSNDYLIAVNVVEQAKQSLAIHEVQLLMAQYNLLTTSGTIDN